MSARIEDTYQVVVELDRAGARSEWRAVELVGRLATAAQDLAALGLVVAVPPRDRGVVRWYLPPTPVRPPELLP